MKVGIIISKRAEKEFKLQVNKLLKVKGISLIEIEDFPLYLTDKDLDKYDADYFVAISIHSLSDSPRRFCVHPCGNWNEKWPRHPIDLGGNERTLCMHLASLLKFAYNSLQKHNFLEAYEISMEATHHGPELSRPILMLELGSCLDSWQDVSANKVIVDVVEDILENFKPSSAKASLILGGDHYMHTIAPLLSKDDFAVSHMCPSSQIHNFDANMLKQALNQTKEEVDLAIIDLAGVGQHQERLIKLLKSNNLPYKFLHEMI